MTSFYNSIDNMKSILDSFQDEKATIN